VDGYYPVRVPNANLTASGGGLLRVRVQNPQTLRFHRYFDGPLAEVLLRRLGRTWIGGEIDASLVHVTERLDLPQPNLVGGKDSTALGWPKIARH
jgi:hypothetical protein